MSGEIRRMTGQEFIPALVEGFYWTGCGNTSGRGNMARLLGSAVCAGVILIHTPPMGGTKATAMPVVAHGGLKLLMRFLDCSWVVGGVAEVAATAECEPLTAAAFNKVSKDLIYKYCLVVVAASWSRAAPLLVVAEARLLKCPSNCAIISSEERGMAGFLQVGGWVGDAVEMPWVTIARLFEPKESPH